MQLSLNADLPLMSGTPFLGVLHTDRTNNGASSTSWFFGPSLDIFVVPHLSVGLLFTYVKTDATLTAAGISVTGSSSRIQAGARVGYDFALGSQVSLWPRLGLIYEHETDTPALGRDTTGHSFSMNVFAPVLWHPVPHFFLGGGPLFATQMTREYAGQDASKATSYGLQGIIGGYFGG